MKKNNLDHTMMFNVKTEEEINEARQVLKEVYEALKEKGYNPINQLVGYFLSGDPAYITSHKNARSIVRRLERDDLLEEIVSVYLNRELG
ncbi:MAG TPA: IreB family regulatory phosphoprotein [Firmicutes bacterium]|nr:IreB family regulatory phosphoprotein [Bacillota bacterium]